MAMFDAKFEFLDDEEIIGTTTEVYEGTTAKTLNWCDTDLEMGTGTPLWFNARVGTTDYVGGTSVQVKLWGDDTAGGHDSSSTLILAGPIIATATAVAGCWLLRCPLPVNVDDLQYLGVGAYLDGAMTGGTIDAWLDSGPQSSFDTQVSTSNIS